MKTENERLDSARHSVLDSMEAGRKTLRFAIGAASLLEVALLVACVLLVDWGDRRQILLFVIFLLMYFIIMLGMVGLAGHVTASTGRILKVMEAREPE